MNATTTLLRSSAQALRSNVVASRALAGNDIAVSCSNVWTDTTTIKPAYEQFGYGAGMFHPIQRPESPM